MSQFLITGTKSGIGKFFSEKFGGLSLTRENAEEVLKKIEQEGVETIIHAAFNTKKDVTHKDLSAYVDDNVYLTERLLSLPHKTFIFLSSVNVYPPSEMPHREDEPILMDQVKGIYGVTKLMSEARIQAGSPHHMILRPTGFLGSYSRREGNLMRVLESKGECKLSLTKDSEMNYVAYDDVFEFVRDSIEQNRTGIFNIASSKNVRMEDAVSLLGKKATFGTFNYSVGAIDNSKVVAHAPRFQKSSGEVVLEFAKANGYL